MLQQKKRLWIKANGLRLKNIYENQRKSLPITKRSSKWFPTAEKRLWTKEYCLQNKFALAGMKDSLKNKFSLEVKDFFGEKKGENSFH